MARLSLNGCSFIPIVFAAVAGAQAPTGPTQEGLLSLAVGIGQGRLTQDCALSVCPLAFAPQQAWMMRIGYHAPQGIVALEYDRWRISRTVNGSETSLTYQWIGPSVQWFPISNSRFRGLYGHGLLAIASFDGNPNPRGLRGLGYGGGLGFDIPVLGGLVITPSWDVLAAERVETTRIVTGRDGRPTESKVWFRAVMKSLGIAMRIRGL